MFKLFAIVCIVIGVAIETANSHLISFLATDESKSIKSGPIAIAMSENEEMIFYEQAKHSVTIIRSDAKSLRSIDSADHEFTAFLVPHDHYLIGCTAEGLLFFWNTSDWSLIASKNASALGLSKMRSLAGWNDDDDIFAVGHDQEISLWNMSNHSLVKVIAQDQSSHYLVALDRGLLIGASRQSSQVQLIDTEKAVSQNVFNASEDVWSLVRLNANQVAVGTYSLIEIFDAQDWSRKMGIRAFNDTEKVWSLSVHNETMLASVSDFYGSDIRIWDAKNGSLVKEIKQNHQGLIRSVQFFLSGVLATFGYDTVPKVNVVDEPTNEDDEEKSLSAWQNYLIAHAVIGFVFGVIYVVSENKSDNSDLLIGFFLILIFWPLAIVVLIIFCLFCSDSSGSTEKRPTGRTGRIIWIIEADA